jgi:hypothetical protein
MLCYGFFFFFFKYFIVVWYCVKLVLPSYHWLYLIKESLSVSLAFLSMGDGGSWASLVLVRKDFFRG